MQNETVDDDGSPIYTKRNGDSLPRYSFTKPHESVHDRASGSWGWIAVGVNRGSLGRRETSTDAAAGESKISAGQENGHLFDVACRWGRHEEAAYSRIVDS